jgi:hypothetical protein
MADQELPRLLRYELVFSSKGVCLGSGEPLSEEESVIIRCALDRYVSSFSRHGNPTAFDRFVEWAVSFREGMGKFDFYEARKHHREVRIQEAGEWSLQFATPEERRRIDEFERMMKSYAEDKGKSLT